MWKMLKVMLVLLLLVAGFPTTSNAYGWGFKKGTNHEPPEVGKYGTILEQNGGYYIDNSGEKVVYLTFDNGYEAGYTEPILDVLKKEEVPATFFLTGHYVRSEPDLVKRMAEDGHIIGNHSYHHPDFTNISKEEFREELKTLDSAIHKITGQEKLQYVRPPRGTFNEQTIQWANELGYIHVFWSLAFVDWHSDKKQGWESAYRQVMDQIHPGAIILLHTVSEDNAAALVHFITDLRKQGYTFKSLDDLVIKDIMPNPLLGL
ncbi:peptidoglycan-N-acetylmuramic acid deacetylase [Natronobacillus azotifigens]|uniref:Delta-lactam-biosynthetic de-N-acetylase n=1 Tax=Natronobacillus azotifigens TaxID=472978 RepID=A0A9J6RBX2_9BACI|nr:delta-lactam-biosynthetic de-N-acetylase [Natronobacillus azotifigens]MCZ0702835.1 delta-lactam-biosynthetic de-N-acetylase [Natronobacillus azotifigens]